MSFVPVLAALTVTIAALAAPPSSSADAAAAATDVRSTRVRLSTGVALEVAERGAPDGEPVLFLHGLTDSWFSFSTVLDRLPPTIRAIVPSQRGHGDSERPECCYRPADFAADALALLDALGVRRATIVGHSMGSFVAQRIAIDAPARVSRLVLIGSGATIRTAPVLELHDSVRKLTDPVSPAFIRNFQHGTVAKPVPAVFMERIVQESAKLPARVWRAALDGLVAPDAANPVERITAETLIVWGDKDAMWSSADHVEQPRLDNRLGRQIVGANGATLQQVQCRELGGRAIAGLAGPEQLEQEFCDALRFGERPLGAIALAGRPLPLSYRDAQAGDERH
jgi:non-heme chloroperoxidase